MSVTGPGCERCNFNGTVAIPGNAWTRKPCDHCGGLSAFAHHNPNTPITMAIPPPDSGEDSVACIARLTRERDEAVKAAVEHRKRYDALERKWTDLVNSESNKALKARAAALVEEIDALKERNRQTVGDWRKVRAELTASATHAESLEARLDTARRWSRLWHAEARRLWREVQALSDRLYCDCGKAHERGTCPWENDE